jgi:hypothetical protein
MSIYPSVIAAALTVSAPATAQTWPPSFETDPPCPRNGLELSVTIFGEWPNGCIPDQIEASVLGREIHLDTAISGPMPRNCTTAITPWSLDAPVGRLTTGRYEFVATLTVGGAPGQPVHVGTLDIGPSCDPVCPADCDSSTGLATLDLFDFLCFQDLFVEADPYACDFDISSGAGTCDVLDFLAFQNAFVSGCP